MINDDIVEVRRLNLITDESCILLLTLAEISTDFIKKFAYINRRRKKENNSFGSAKELHYENKNTFGRYSEYLVSSFFSFLMNYNTFNMCISCFLYKSNIVSLI